MTRQMLINNTWCDSHSGQMIDCINPATEQKFDQVPRADAVDVDKAVAAARAAFNGGWRQTSGTERAALLRKLAEGIQARRDDLAAFETRDNGKPLAEATFDVDTAVQIYTMYAEMAEDLDAKGEENVALPVDFLQSGVTYRPIGVIGMITPWNFPIEQFTWKVSAALAAGCTCVVKPSEFTSITALMLGEIAVEAGFPPGVLNIVTGYGPEVGEAMVLDPRVDKVSFTGSTSTGRRVMELASRDLKRISLELGGKNPIIIFDDVDLDRAAEWTAFGAFVNQGQVCTATSRLLLHKGRATEFLGKLKDLAESIVVGDGSKEGVQMGPLVSEAQFAKVNGYIEAGRDAGARLLTGGDRPTGLNTGYFVNPTIFTDVKPDMSIWTDEIFGPVLSVMEFEEEQDAIRLANNTPYGLAATVLSEDKARAERVAEQLDAGITWQNCNQMVVIQSPWGGVKKSGMGRELGRWGLENFLEPKQKTRWLPDAGLGWYQASS
ncbi:MAG: aldehyde dehydrogenase family protein [Pseudomonadota bacterium]